MTDIDDLVRATVTPRLRPGETLHAIGYLRRPHPFKRYRQLIDYDHHYVAITDQRLVLFRTTPSTWLGKFEAKIETTPPIVWELGHLAAIDERTIAGWTEPAVLLLARPGQGPRPDDALEMPRSFPAIADQARFVSTIQWLRSEIAADRFLTPEIRDAVAAHEARHAAEERAKAERAAASPLGRLATVVRASPKVAAAAGVAAIALVCSCVPLGYAAYALSEWRTRVGYDEEEVAAYDACVASGRRRGSCPGHPRDGVSWWAESAAEYRDEALGSCCCGSTFVMLALAGVAGGLAARKRT